MTMKKDKGYCSACNCTTTEHNLEHVHEEHFGGNPVITGLLPMWYSPDHSGHSRAIEFWVRWVGDG